MAINKKSTTDTPVNGNIDLGFSPKKKRFSVGGDPNIIIEFDPSDLGVVSRLSKAIPRFNALQSRWEEINNLAENSQNVDEDSDVLETAKAFSDKLDGIEKEVRDIIDEVFDGEVADKLLGNSSAFSPVNGLFKYEHIITAMLKCFEQNIQDEAPKFNARKVSQKYTHKYIKK